jgi:hypothetical protein
MGKMGVVAQTLENAKKVRYSSLFFPFTVQEWGMSL